MTHKFEKAYSENQKPELGSRDEFNAWHDYKQARDSDSDHEAALEFAAGQAAKFSSTKGMATPKAEINKYRKLAESCQRTAVSQQ